MKAGASVFVLGMGLVLVNVLIGQHVIRGERARRVEAEEALRTTRATLGDCSTVVQDQAERLRSPPPVCIEPVPIPLVAPLQVACDVDPRWAEHAARAWRLCEPLR